MKERILQIEIAGVPVAIHRKRMKNIYIHVSREDGSVSISVPMHMSKGQIEAFAQSREDWIVSKSREAKERAEKTAISFVTGDKILLWGEEYPLEVEKTLVKTERMCLRGDRIHMIVHADADMEHKQKLLEQFYRKQMKKVLPEVIAFGEQVVGKSAREYRIKKMKTRWGTCNVTEQRVWLNLNLVRKPRECLDYVMVHELTHLWEANHGVRFKALMSKFYPQWQEVKHCLNQ